MIPPDEVEFLRQLYREFRIPIDQYQRRPQELEKITEAWNASTNREDSPSELLHFMVTKRKQKLWVTLDGAHRRLRGLSEDFLSSIEWQTLHAIYMEDLIPNELGSDNLAYDDLLSAQLARDFYSRTGRNVSGCLLFAAIMQKRKRGEWAKINPAQDEKSKQKPSRPFGDIDKLAG